MTWWKNNIDNLKTRTVISIYLTPQLNSRMIFTDRTIPLSTQGIQILKEQWAERSHCNKETGRRPRNTLMGNLEEQNQLSLHGWIRVLNNHEPQPNSIPLYQSDKLILQDRSRIRDCMERLPSRVHPASIPLLQLYFKSDQVQHVAWPLIQLQSCTLKAKLLQAGPSRRKESSCSAVNQHVTSNCQRGKRTFLTSPIRRSQHPSGLRWEGESRAFRYSFGRRSSWGTFCLRDMPHETCVILSEAITWTPPLFAFWEIKWRAITLW
jgi:hypothetical protein